MQKALVMQRKLVVSAEEHLFYTVKSVSRSKSVRLIVHSDGTLTLTKPFWMSASKAEVFANEKVEWIRKHVLQAKERAGGRLLHQGDAKEYERLYKRALALVEAKVERINRAQYNFVYGNISIRNQKTRWGSCSKSGNLSFNYRIALLPAECADYLVVHELCHLKEFNHSPAFWALVARACPNYRAVRHRLKSL
jgi:predicted metal-dependent hydrolase